MAMFTRTLLMSRTLGKRFPDQTSRSVQENNNANKMQTEINKMMTAFGTTTMILPSNDFTTTNNIDVGHSVELKVSKVLQAGLSVKIRNFVLFDRDFDTTISPDIRFNRTVPNHQRYAYLLCEIISVQILQNKSIIWLTKAETLRKFQCDNLYAIIKVNDTYINMDNYDDESSENFDVGFLQQDILGAQRIFIAVGKPLEYYTMQYGSFLSMSKRFASLAFNVHKLNRNHSLHETYRRRLLTQEWPTNNARFRQFIIDKALQIVGSMAFNGRGGTKIIGRQIRQISTPVQTLVNIFDNISQADFYRYDEVQRARFKSRLELHRKYGISGL